MAAFQNYELIGSYFTAGERTPMYTGLQRGSDWVVYPKPYDYLETGKTYPIAIAGRMNVNGKDLFYTNPGYDSKLGGNVATFFENKTNTIANINKDLVHTEGSSYYVKPTENAFTSFGKSLQNLLLLGLGAWVVSSYFKGRHD